MSNNGADSRLPENYSRHDVNNQHNRTPLISNAPNNERAPNLQHLPTPTNELLVMPHQVCNSSGSRSHPSASSSSSSSSLPSWGQQPISAEYRQQQFFPATSPIKRSHVEAPFTSPFAAAEDQQTSAGSNSKRARVDPRPTSQEAAGTVRFGGGEQLQGTNSGTNSLWVSSRPECSNSRQARRPALLGSYYTSNESAALGAAGRIILEMCSIQRDGGDLVSPPKVSPPPPMPDCDHNTTGPPNQDTDDGQLKKLLTENASLQARLERTTKKWQAEQKSFDKDRDYYVRTLEQMTKTIEQSKVETAASRDEGKQKKRSDTDNANVAALAGGKKSAGERAACSDQGAAKLVGENLSLKKKLGELQKELNVKNQHSTKMEAEKKVIETERDAVRGKLLIFEKKYPAAKATLIETKKELDETKANLDRANNDLSKSRSDLSTMRERLKLLLECVRSMKDATKVEMNAVQHQFAVEYVRLMKQFAAEVKKKCVATIMTVADENSRLRQQISAEKSKYDEEKILLSNSLLKKEAELKAEREAKDRTEDELKLAMTSQEKAEDERKSALQAKQRAEEKLEAAVKSKQEELNSALLAKQKAEKERNSAMQAKEQSDEKIKVAVLAKQRAEKELDSMTKSKEKSEEEQKLAIQAKQRAEKELETATKSKEKADDEQKSALQAKQRAEEKLEAVVKSKEEELNLALLAKEKAEKERNSAIQAKEQLGEKVKVAILAKEKAEEEQRVAIQAKHRAEKELETATKSKEKAEEEQKSAIQAKHRAEKEIESLTKSKEKAEAEQKLALQAKERSDEEKKAALRASEQSKKELILARLLAKQGAEEEIKLAQQAKEKAEEDLKMALQVKEKAKEEMKVALQGKQRIEEMLKAAKEKAKDELKAAFQAKEKAEEDLKVLQQAKDQANKEQLKEAEEPVETSGPTTAAENASACCQKCKPELEMLRRRIRKIDRRYRDAVFRCNMLDQCVARFNDAEDQKITQLRLDLDRSNQQVQILSTFRQMHCQAMKVASTLERKISEMVLRFPDPTVREDVRKLLSAFQLEFQQELAKAHHDSS